MPRLEKGPESAFFAQSKIRFPSVPGIVAGKPIPIFKNYLQCICILYKVESSNIVSHPSWTIFLSISHFHLPNFSIAELMQCVAQPGYQRLGRWECFVL